MKKFMLILLALLLICTSAVAESDVKYEGGAEKFVFLPGSEYSDSDLFTHYKNVMPGDVIEEKIRVENSTDNEVHIYMRAEGSNKADQDFLHQLHLSVKSGDSSIFVE